MNGFRRALTLLELIVVTAIVGTLIGLTLPAIHAARQTAAKRSCSNNLRQLGLALHQYHESHGSLPPGCTYRNNTHPQPHMSWLTRLLPFVEQEALWQESVAAFQADRFFENGLHKAILAKAIPLYLCPLDDASQTPKSFGRFTAAFTDYLGNEGTSFAARDGVLFIDSSVRRSEITDGTSQTLLAGERPPPPDGFLGWWYAGWGQQKTGSAEYVLGVRETNAYRPYDECAPGPYRFTSGRGTDRCDAFHFWSNHAGGAHFLFCDGSVRFLSYSADGVLPALATRSGGEVAEVP